LPFVFALLAAFIWFARSTHVPRLSGAQELKQLKAEELMKNHDAPALVTCARRRAASASCGLRRNDPSSERAQFLEPPAMERTLAQSGTGKSAKGSTDLARERLVAALHSPDSIA